MNAAEGLGRSSVIVIQFHKKVQFKYISPIKKTGKKTPAGMGNATDTAVMIN